MFQDLLKFKSSYGLYLIPYGTKDVLSWGFQVNKANEMNLFFSPQANQMRKSGKAKALKMEREKLRNMFRHTTNRTGDRTAAYGLSLQLPGPTDPALISADPSGSHCPSVVVVDGLMEEFCWMMGSGPQWVWNALYPRSRVSI